MQLVKELSDLAAKLREAHPEWLLEAREIYVLDSTNRPIKTPGLRVQSVGVKAMTLYFREAILVLAIDCDLSWHAMFHPGAHFPTIKGAVEGLAEELSWFQKESGK